MPCRHASRTLVNYELDYDAALPVFMRRPVPQTPVDVCVAWQCNDCGAFLGAAHDVDVAELQRTDLPRVDTIAWDESIRGRLAAQERETTTIHALQFLSGAIRR